MARREPLNREKILDAALELADRDGLDGLSMRRLAKRLGVEAMSLYNHVASKTDILDGLAERVYGGVERPDPALPWPERIRSLALAMYRAFSRHPVVPMSLITDQANPKSMRALLPLEDLIAALAEAGFDDTGIRQTLGAVNSLIFGSLMLSTNAFTARPDEQQLEPYMTTVDPAVLPHFSRLVRVLPAHDPERDFIRALDVLLTGLVATADQHEQPSGGTPAE